jgi:hypothetical protein
MPGEDGLRCGQPDVLATRGKEGNTMVPLYTLLLCLPAALALIVCACGLAVLWSPTAQPTPRPRPRAGRGAGAVPHETARE